MNPLQDFGNYLKDIFDADKNGDISPKEMFIAAAGLAPLAIAIFVEALVAVAEVRVWDLGMEITGDPWKAIGFVLISAFPFYLGQLAWLYPRANNWQKAVGLGTIAGGLFTSAIFGRADLLIGIDAFGMSETDIVQLSTSLIPVYIVAGLFYLWQDAGITQIRTRIIAKAKAQNEADKLANMRIVLREYQKTHTLRREIENEFGASNVAEYEQGGKKPKNSTRGGNLPAPVPLAHETESVKLDGDPNAKRGGE